MASEMIARYYDEAKNPDNAALPGVPLRDLTEDEVNAMPEWLQQSIDEQPFYRKTKARTAAKADEAATKE